MGEILLIFIHYTVEYIIPISRLATGKSVYNTGGTLLRLHVMEKNIKQNLIHKFV